MPANWFPTLRFRSALWALALGCGACGQQPIDGPVTTLIVTGVVEDEAGAALSGSVVRVSWSPWACGILETFPPDTTTASGAFDVWLWAWGEFPRACVRIEAEPPTNRALSSGAVQIDAVPLDSRRGPDTLAVRITLPNGP
jgi:hypothetical protein